MAFIYRAPASISAYVPQAIAAAYADAGIDRPTPPEQQIEAALRALPDAPTVARTIIAEAHDTDQAPAKFLAQARRRVTEAQANDALREHWGRHGRDITAARLPQVTDQAAQDLSPAFSTLVEGLRQAARELTPDTPGSAPVTGTPRGPSGQAIPGPISLDPEAAIARDAGAALTAARTQIARLATFAGISVAAPLSNSAASGLAPLVPVLAVEGVVVEHCLGTIGESLTTTNESKLGITRDVRRLAADARNDIDAAIVGIAHGNYAGCSLRLNDTAQRQATLEAITAAFDRNWSDAERDKSGGRAFAIMI